MYSWYFSEETEVTKVTSEDAGIVEPRKNLKTLFKILPGVFLLMILAALVYYVGLVSTKLYTNSCWVFTKWIRKLLWHNVEDLSVPQTLRETNIGTLIGCSNLLFEPFGPLKCHFCNSISAEKCFHVKSELQKFL